MFIYVTTEAAKQKLLEQGFPLLKDCAASSTYIFVANDKLCFDCSEIEYALSDVLTF